MAATTALVLGGGFGGISAANSLRRLLPSEHGVVVIIDKSPQFHVGAAGILSRASSEIFDGRGFCYLETGAERALRADGSFFELPHPVMETRPADEAQFRDKRDWVARHLQPIR